MPPRMIIRPATAEDAPAMADIHRQSFPTPWTSEDMARFLSSGTVMAWIAERGVFRDDGKTVQGFLLCQVSAGVGDILSFAVAPDYRGCGVGRGLLRTLLQAAAARGITAITLETAANNQPAIAVYRRFGFTAAGCRRGYYRHHSNGSVADAVVMRWEADGSRS